MKNYQFVANIGYVDYAINEEDAVALLKIAARVVPVKQENWAGPYYPKPENEEPFVKRLEMAEVKYPETEPFTEAQYAISDETLL